MDVAPATKPATSELARAEPGGGLADLCVAALRPDKHALLPVSSSLQRASDHLLANPDGRITAQELARIAGVTLRTLRLNAKTCLGIPLARVVEHVKLAWVRERLVNPGESRSIAQLAEAIGYQNPSSLARSYQRHFGETPTQTRSRAFTSERRDIPVAMAVK